MREDGKVDYVELPGGALGETKRFYAEAFGWAFTDYGPEYAAFAEGLDGGFTPHATAKAALVILYAHDLEAMAGKVVAARGEITQPIYGFPGGRRFHFRDPAGNELAVWSEAGAASDSAD